MKKLLTGCFIGLFLAGFLFMGPAPGASMELKFAHFMSPKHIQHQKSFVPFTQKVAELTGGKVTVKMYPGGALGKPKQLPDAARDGITDIAFIIPSYTTARFPVMSVMDLPFQSNSAHQATLVIYDLYNKYFARDFKDYKVLWLYSSGPGQFMSIDTPITSMESVNGLKMRTPSAYMSKLLKILKANPIGMPISKLTMSLQKRVIDGCVAPYSTVKDFQMFDLIGQITEANIYVSPMAVVMNKAKWNSLPDDAKKAIDQASGRQMGLHAAKVYDDHDINTFKEIQERGKTHITVLPKDERDRIIKAVRPMSDGWVKDMSKKGLPAKQILADVTASFNRNR